MKTIILFASLFLSMPAMAKCFEFSGKGPSQVGPVDFKGYAADSVCVYKVGGFGGRTYYSVSFSDDQGDIGQFASQTELLGRCPGFCRSYELTSGNALGQNVDPDGTTVEFMVEPNGLPGKISLTYDGETHTFELNN